MIMEEMNRMPELIDAMTHAQRRLSEGPAIGSRWRHFKGGIYRVIDNVVLEEDCDHLVIYISEMTGNKVARRLSVFTGIHPTHKVKRFEQIS